MRPSRLLSVLFSSLAAVAAAAVPATEILPTTGLGLPVLGHIQPRHAKDIVDSPWSIGA